MKAEHAQSGFNRLLALLPASGHQDQHQADALEPVMLAYGDILSEPGQRVDYVYFPLTCLITMLAVAGDNMALEVSLVGSEGMAGLDVAMGGGVTQLRAWTQKPGLAMRMRSAHLLECMKNHPAWQHALHRYAHGVMVEAMQMAVCNRYHPLQARVARSLLLVRDRLQADEFHLTHALLACKLGVRRVGVTNAASTLQRHDVIRYNRGDIRILDAARLEMAACSCSRTIVEYD